MFLKLDGDRPDTSAVLVVVTVTLGEDQISRDVEIVLDHLKSIIEPSLLLFLPSYLSDSPLCIPRGSLLLDPVEDEIVPGVGVQLPGLLLQVLHHPPDVVQFPEELLLDEPLLLTVKVLLARGGVVSEFRSQESRTGGK